jgi:hypothetical protein
MLTFYYGWQAADEAGVLPEPDTGLCELKVACDPKQPAWIGVSSEGDWRCFGVFTHNDDAIHAPEAKPVLACEDCANWIKESVEEGVQDE